MKLFLRILIFILCIYNAPIYAIENSTQIMATEEFELLENNYAQLEIPADTPTTISIIRTLEKILNLVQERYYSLLNWNSYTRIRPLKIPKYQREEHFGRWINDPNDGTCYNTRAIVLIRDSDKEVTFSESNKCSVMTGSWHDDYTGETFTKREDIQIDHLVALKNAYISGAYRWGFKARCLYANYLGYDFHLKSVNATQNMKKSDRAPDKYMPPNSEYACSYLKNWLSVKFLWGMRMTAGEATFIYGALRDNKCNLANFKISAKEIIRQNEFANENSELCEAIAN